MKRDSSFTVKWRSKRLHRKCVYCAYCRLLPDIPSSYETWYCDIKETEVNPNIHRPFCSAFCVDEKACAYVNSKAFQTKEGGTENE